MINNKNCSGIPEIDFQHYSQILGRKKLAKIIVPSNEPPLHGWDVCYILHPFGGNRNSWINHFFVENKNYIGSCIYVFPETGRRWMINDDQGNKYEDYFIRELMPKIEKNFHTSGNRIIGGFSMGGATAFFFALNYPLLFSATFSIAGAFEASKRLGDPYLNCRSENCMIPTEQEHNRVWGDNLNTITRQTYDIESILSKSTNSLGNIRIFFEVGAHDHQRIIDMNRKMEELLLERNISHDYSEHPSGDHSWLYAAGALQGILKKIYVIK